MTADYMVIRASEPPPPLVADRVKQSRLVKTIVMCFMLKIFVLECCSFLAVPRKVTGIQNIRKFLSQLPVAELKKFDRNIWLLFLWDRIFWRWSL